jgi:mono/diheme cytochrome c family protein
MRAIPQWRGGLPLVIPFKFAKLAAALFGAVVVGMASPSGLAAADTQDPADASAMSEYQAVIAPILEKHCYECHGDGFDKGKVAFDTLDTDEKLLKPDLWLRVLNNTRAGLMPAEKKPRLSAGEQQKLERWIKYGVFKIDPHNPDPGRVTVRRLNRVEYRNTVRDLLGVDYNTDHEFPPDDTGFGFDNIGDALTTSPMLMEKYVAAAQTIVGEAVPTAPRKPIEQILKGMSFEGQAARTKWAKRQLVFSEPANIGASFKTNLAGSYRVKFNMEVNGAYTPDPGKARIIFKIDGKEFLNQEFAYHDEKAYEFESTHKWQPAEHRLSIELQPTVPPEKKETIIDLFVHKVTIEGPLEKAHWVKTENYDRYFPRPVPGGARQRHAYAKELLAAFAQKAYRRPLSPQDGDDTAERLANLAEAYYREPGKSFEQGVAHAMAAVLSSPRFLFKLEAPAAHELNAQVAEVDEYTLASRLSYFLWSTMPDDELLNLAARGELRKQLPAQVKRMLADPRSENLARNFTGQWLQARDVEGIAMNPREVIIRDAGEEAAIRELRQAWRNQDEATAKRLAEYIDKIVDSKPEFDNDMRKAMRRETEMFFGYLISENRPVIELIDSDYTFVNEQLAALYGLPGVTGPEMRKVMLPAGSGRGGVLTQGSALLVTSNPDRTSPVKRGLFVLANFLGTPPPPPPANVPALEASEGDFKGHDPVLRDILKKHRENPACASCHNRMDPIGLAFENFNALGMWRDSERKQPIAASGNLITGESFSSVAELKRILAGGHRQEFYQTLSRKLLTYASGRGTEYYDVETIDEIVSRLNANDGRFSALLMGVIESAPFQKMRTQATATVAN